MTLGLLIVCEYIKTLYELFQSFLKHKSMNEKFFGKKKIINFMIIHIEIHC